MKKSTFFILLFLFTVSGFAQETNNACADAKIRILGKKQHFNTNKTAFLPSFAYDLKYHRLNLEVNPAVRYIKGAVTSYFMPKISNFNQIGFEISQSLTVDSVKMHDLFLTYWQANDIVSINLPTTLPIDMVDSITVFYQGVPPTTGFGAFETTLHVGIPVLWTLSEPYGAKEWWPSKQSLNDKVDSVDIIVTTPQEYRVASNGILVSEVIDGTTKIAHWKHRHSIAAYLIAIAVTNYAVYSEYSYLSPTDSVEVLNYVYPEYLNVAQANTHNVLDVLQLYSQLFIAYPFKDEKYGHAQFGWGGGMEHQTMSFMGGFSHELMAHELAHQWFGDFVTCGSWKDIWLNEGFATYLEGLTTEHGLNSDGQTFTDWKRFKIANATSGVSGSVYVDDTTSVNRIFNSRLSYAKGAMVLHTLRKTIGDVAFFTGLQNYLNDANLANSYVYTTDLQQHLEATSGISLQYLFNDWIYGQGYPIYTIFHSQNLQGTVSVQINQTTTDASVSFFHLKVPIKFSGASQDTTIIFDNTFSGEVFNFDLPFVVNLAELDPNKDLITRSSQVLVIKNHEIESQIYLSPNPVKTLLTIELPDKIKFDKISVYNSIGQVIIPLNCTFQKNKYEVDTSNFSSGTYYVRFLAKGIYVTKKFVK